MNAVFYPSLTVQFSHNCVFSFFSEIDAATERIELLQARVSATRWKLLHLSFDTVEGVYVFLDLSKSKCSDQILFIFFCCQLLFLFLRQQKLVT